MRNRKQSGSLAAALSIGLVLILLVGFVGWATNGFRDKGKFGEWFGKEEPEPPVAGAIDGEGNELKPGESYPLPGNMIFRSSAASAEENTTSSVTLTATIEPANAENQRVAWSCSWKTDNPSWSQGKNISEYITVTPSTEGSKTATVSCLQPFATKIAIKVTSEENSSATATCTVDYAKRVTGVSGAVSYADKYDLTFAENTPVNVNFDMDDELTDWISGVEWTYAYGVGTLDQNVTASTVFRLSEVFRGYFSGSGISIEIDDAETYNMFPFLNRAMFGEMFQFSGGASVLDSPAKMNLVFNKFQQAKTANIPAFQLNVLLRVNIRPISRRLIFTWERTASRTV